MKISILRWDNGDVIFERECEGNSVRATLEAGVAEGIDFFRADLSGADLNFARLSGAKLSGAELNDTDLNYAELNDADLSGANLNCAKLNRAKLPKHNVIINDRWHIHITKGYIKIGCQTHQNEWWINLSTDEAQTKFHAGEWWAQWKPVVLAIADSFVD